MKQNKSEWTERVTGGTVIYQGGHHIIVCMSNTRDPVGRHITLTENGESRFEGTCEDWKPSWKYGVGLRGKPRKPLKSEWSLEEEEEERNMKNLNRYRVTHYGLGRSILIGSSSPMRALKKSFGDPGAPIQLFQSGLLTRVGNPVRYDIQVCGRWSKKEERIFQRARRNEPGYLGNPVQDE